MQEFKKLKSALRKINRPDRYGSELLGISQAHFSNVSLGKKNASLELRAKAGRLAERLMKAKPTAFYL